MTGKNNTPAGSKKQNTRRAKKPNQVLLSYEGRLEDEEAQKVELVEAPEKSNTAKDPDTENMLIKGENLSVLKALEKDYAGKVKCIYIDPPYNTGRQWCNYNDKMTRGDWLNFMRSRLKALKNLLSEDGSIFISIDTREGAYLKVLCDEVFGEKNNWAEIIWQRRGAPMACKKAIGAVHENVFWYGKNKNKTFYVEPPRTEKMKAGYSNPDNDPRGPWRGTGPTCSNGGSTQIYPITAPNGKILFPPPVGIGL